MEDDQSLWNLNFNKEGISGAVGSSVKLAVLGADKNGAALAVDMAEVTFSSADASVASVDAAGNVKLLKAGSTVIYAKIDVIGITKTATITVTVQ